MSDAVIDALRPLARDPACVQVVAGGERVGTLRREQADALGLREGARWTAALARRVQAVIDDEACRTDALRRLGRRDMTRAMLAERLAQRWGEALAERTVRSLVEQGWIDDRGYAERRAESLQRRAPIATEALEARLESEGVPTTLARSAARDSTDPSRLAEQLRAWKAQRRTATWIARTLGRQGFDFDTIASALHRAGIACPSSD